MYCLTKYPKIKRIVEFKLKLEWYFIILATFACIGMTCEYLGWIWWGIDLLASFKIQYLITLFISVMILLFYFKMRKVAAVFSIPLLAMSATLLPIFISFGNSSGSGSSRKIRLLMFNVMRDSNDFKGTQTLIEEENPDLLVLQETDGEWMKALDKTLASYPNNFVMNSSDNFGMSVFSRFPIKQKEKKYFGGKDNSHFPSLVLTLWVDGKELNLISAHPPPPSQKMMVDFRDRMLIDMGKSMKTVSGAKMIVGDLNITPWNRSFKKCLLHSGLRNSMNGFGVQPTWPARLLICYLFLPIDHCLVSEDIRIEDRRIGAGTDSDHRPLIIDFSF